MYAIKIKNDNKFINSLNGNYIISTVPILFKNKIEINTFNELPLSEDLLELVKIDIYVEKLKKPNKVMQIIMNLKHKLWK